MNSIYKKHLVTTALIWAGCFVLLVFVYMLLLSPQKNTKRSVEQQLAEKKRTYESALKATQPETKAKLNEELENLQTKLQSFVINFEDSANLTFDISQIAKNKQVNAFSIMTKDKRGDPTAPEYEHISDSAIDVHFTSSFNQFASFLNALERYRPVVFVDQFIIKRSDQDNSNHQVSMDLSVFVSKRQDS